MATCEREYLFDEPSTCSYRQVEMEDFESGLDGEYFIDLPCLVKCLDEACPRKCKSSCAYEMRLTDSSGRSDTCRVISAHRLALDPAIEIGLRRQLWRGRKRNRGKSFRQL